MARAPARPERYQLFVIAPDFRGHAVIDGGFCTEADPPLAPWLGCSAEWIYGRIRYEGWRATQLPAMAQGELL